MASEVAREAALPMASMVTSAPPLSWSPIIRQPVTRRTARLSSSGATIDVGPELLGEHPLLGVLGRDHDGAGLGVLRRMAAMRAQAHGPRALDHHGVAGFDPGLERRVDPAGGRLHDHGGSRRSCRPGTWCSWEAWATSSWPQPPPVLAQ